MVASECSQLQLKSSKELSEEEIFLEDSSQNNVLTSNKILFQVLCSASLDSGR